MQLYHGAFYFIARGKWTRLATATEYSQALVAYASLMGDLPKVTTVAEALAEYLRDANGRLKSATLDGYARSSANLQPVFGHLRLDELSPADVYRYLKTAGNVQANRDKAFLSAAYTHARRIGAFQGDDPAKGLRYRNPEQARQRYVTDDEMSALVAKASPKLGCVARFIELTGMRQADALRVRLADIDEEGVHYQQGKTGKRLVVVWSPELLHVVDEAKTLWRRFGREFLFESTPKGKHAKRGPGPYTPSGLRALWRTARKKAGLQDVRLHDLRRKAGSDAETDQEAQARLGHEDGKVTRRHYRAKPQRVKPTR